MKQAKFLIFFNLYIYDNKKVSIKLSIKITDNRIFFIVPIDLIITLCDKKYWLLNVYNDNVELVATINYQVLLTV